MGEEELENPDMIAEYVRDLEKKKAERAQLTADMTTYGNELKTSTEPSREEQIASVLIAALSAGAGYAAGGKNGLAIGGTYGAEAADNYNKLTLARNKEKADSARLGYNTARTQLAATDNDIDTLGKDTKREKIRIAEDKEGDDRYAADQSRKDERDSKKDKSDDIREKGEKRRQEKQDIEMSGAKMKPPSEETKKRMTSAITVKDIGDKYIADFEAQAAKDPSWLSRNVQKQLPATELGKLQRDLGLFAVQLRNAREAGVMTEQDFERYNGYLTIGEKDTMSSVLGRLKELKDVTDITTKAVIKSAKAGYENMDKYEKMFGIEPEEQPQGGVPSVGGTFNGSKVLSVKKLP